MNFSPNLTQAFGPSLRMTYDLTVAIRSWFDLYKKRNLSGRRACAIMVLDDHIIIRSISPFISRPKPLGDWPSACDHLIFRKDGRIYLDRL